MNVIYKYPVSGFRFTLRMPTGATFLSVQNQAEVGMMWFEVDTDAPLETREFVVIGTGHEFETDGLKYLGTYQESTLVWHVYEDVK